MVSTSESMINISSSIGMLVIQMRQWRYADDCGHNLGGIHNFLFFSIFFFQILHGNFDDLDYDDSKTFH